MSSAVASIDETQREVVEEFEFFDDWMDRYQYIVDLGRQLPEFPEDWKTDENRLHGCQSQVWFHWRHDDGSLHFDAISDSAIVSGLIALLLKVYNDRSPTEILAAKPEFISSIGLDKHLSPTRNNGLHAMLEAIYGHARAAA